HAAIDFGLQMQSAMNVTDTEGQSIVPKSHNPILLNRHAAAKVLISHPGLFEARGNGCAQLPSLRSGNSFRTFSGTLHPSPFAFSTSLLRTRLKSLSALSLRTVVIGNLFRCSIQRRNSMSARPVFCTRRNTIMVSST